jgi:fructokinase
MRVISTQMPTLRAPTVVCWGELLWDLFPSGACLGGAPSNVAIHLVGGALPTALITRLGRDDLGAQALQALQELGMDTRGVQMDADMPTGRVGIEVHQGEASYTLHPGAWQRISCDEAARGLLAECQAFCFGSLSQESELGLASWRKALQHLPAECLRVCDPNLRGSRLDAELIREHMRAATVVKINDDEAHLMAQVYGCEDIVPWLLEDMQVTLVARTHGPRGATLFTRDESASHPGFASEPGGDNVGAGDSFTAILIRGLLAGAALEPTLQAANRYASFVAGRRGATPTIPTALREEVATLTRPR